MKNKSHFNVSIVKLFCFVFVSTRSRRKSIKIWFFMILLIKWFMIEGINCDFWKLNLNFYSEWIGLIMIHVWLALSNLFARKPKDADSLKKIIYRGFSDWLDEIDSMPIFSLNDPIHKSFYSLCSLSIF